MKIKGYIVSGLIFLSVGLVGLLIILAYNRFDVRKIATENVVIVENTYNEKVNKIKYDCKADNVVIRATDREDIYVKGKEINNYKYDVKIVDEQLVIECQYGKWYETVFNLSWLNAIGFSSEQLLIEVPKSAELALDIDVKGGQLEVDGLKLNESTVNIKGGSFTAKNIDASKISLDVKGGTSSFEDSKVEELNLNMDATTTKLSNCLIGTWIAKLDASTLNADTQVTVYASLKYSVSTITISLLGDKENYSVNGNGSGPVKVLHEGSVSSVNIKL